MGFLRRFSSGVCSLDMLLLQLKIFRHMRNNIQMTYFHFYIIDVYTFSIFSSPNIRLILLFTFSLFLEILTSSQKNLGIYSFLNNIELQGERKKIGKYKDIRKYWDFRNLFSALLGPVFFYDSTALLNTTHEGNLWKTSWYPSLCRIVMFQYWNLWSCSQACLQILDFSNCFTLLKVLGLLVSAYEDFVTSVGSSSVFQQK